MKMIAVDVAARFGMQTRKAATESHATTGEMASAKAAAHMSATEPAAYMTASAEPAPVSTSTSPAAARKRVGGQSPGESGSRQQYDHGLTEHG
ncbi:MAG: hypothetical protein WBO12_13090, partial [Xanthobacteraceae bacterium]